MSFAGIGNRGDKEMGDTKEVAYGKKMKWLWTKEKCAKMFMENCGKLVHFS